jgi:hypothetical protein
MAYGAAGPCGEVFAPPTLYVSWAAATPTSFAATAARAEDALPVGEASGCRHAPPRSCYLTDVAAMSAINMDRRPLWVALGPTRALSYPTAECSLSVPLGSFAAGKGAATRRRSRDCATLQYGESLMSRAARPGAKHLRLLSSAWFVPSDLDACTASILSSLDRCEGSTLIWSRPANRTSGIACGHAL